MDDIIETKEFKETNYYLCEYYNWDGLKSTRAIEGINEEDVKHRIIGHGMQLISVNRIYFKNETI